MKGEQWLPQSQEMAEIPTPLVSYTGPVTSHTVLQNPSSSIKCLGLLTEVPTRVSDRSQDMGFLEGRASFFPATSSFLHCG